MNKATIARLDRTINEFLYTVIITLTKEQKDSLPRRIRSKINTIQRVKKFLAMASTDQKRELLSFLDYSTFFVLMPSGVPASKEVKELTKRYAAGDIANGLRDAAKSGILVTDDTDFEYGLRRMAQSMTSVPYIQHLQLIRAARATNNWPKKIQLEDEDEATAEDVNVATRFMMAVGFGWELVSVLSPLDRNEMLILMYFFMHIHKYIGREQIDIYFVGKVTKNKTTYALKALIEKMYIRKYMGDNKGLMTITKLGVRVVADYRDKIVNATVF